MPRVRSVTDMAPEMCPAELFPQEITILTSENLRKNAHQDKIKKIIDNLGLLSAKSQNLKHAITSYEKLIESNHKLYLAVDLQEDDGKGTVIGFLKLGEKGLFVTDGSEPARPANMHCVLDFYINFEYQRHGWGKHIFEYAIHQENADPQNMAYDRPSEKLINFLAKHYHLTDVIEQPNRYVVYRDYFNNMSVKYTQGRCLTNSEIRPGSAGYLYRRY